MKIIGYWASDLTVKWDEIHLADVQQNVNKLILQVSGFVDSPHLEVQERVSVHDEKDRDLTEALVDGLIYI